MAAFLPLEWVLNNNCCNVLRINLLEVCLDAAPFCLRAPGNRLDRKKGNRKLTRAHARKVLHPEMGFSSRQLRIDTIKITVSCIAMALNDDHNFSK